MIISKEELSAITLKSSFIYEYGDLPHFMSCINSFPLHFFVRYRSSKEDPSQHRWSRLLKVVRREVPAVGGSINSNVNDSNGDVSGAGGGTSSTNIVPLQWREKKFLITLSVEGEEKYVDLPRISLQLPSENEVMSYCARHVELEANDTGDVEVERSSRARDQLPSAHEIQKLREFRRNVIENHRWTPEEVAQAREQNELMGRVGASCAPVRLTVASMNNMLFESKLSIASSRRAVGHLAAAMERRNAVRLPHSSSSVSATPPQTVAGTGSQLTNVSQCDMGGIESQGTTQFDEERVPEVDPQVLQEMVKAWGESVRHGEEFYKYVSNKDRSAYLTKIATITQNNYEKNRQDRVRGIANEKRLDRKANLVESGGLWIVDDKLRAKLAQNYRQEQDGEAGVGHVEASVDGKKGNDSRKLPGGLNALDDTKGQTVGKEETMLQRFMRYHKEQELSFASVPDSFVDEVTGDNLSLSTSRGKDAQHDTDGLNTALGKAVIGHSPELLSLSSNPQVVTSQLLHRVTCMSGRMSLKRGHSVSNKS